MDGVKNKFGRDRGGDMIRSGDWVEILDRESLLATLDVDGTDERMPFMPEMLQYCGRRFRVSKVAHKTCDPAHKTGGRSLNDCFHLENLRCDGSAHGGCQATCLIFWKGSWLRKVADGSADASLTPVVQPRSVKGRGCSEDALRAATHASLSPLRYSCQATQLIHASRPLRGSNPLQYFRDWRSGNVRFRELTRGLVLAWIRALNRLPVGNRITLTLYDRAHRLLVGREAPQRGGVIPIGTPTPVRELNVVPGERVRVKSYDDILATLNVQNKNRGLWFDVEMVQFCEREFRVSHRVTRILNERSGEMMEMKHSCVVLQGVQCEAQYSLGRLFCPRGITAYWREGWLERAGGASVESPNQPRG